MGFSFGIVSTLRLIDFFRFLTGGGGGGVGSFGVGGLNSWALVISKTESDREFFSVNPRRLLYKSGAFGLVKFITITTKANLSSPLFALAFVANWRYYFVLLMNFNKN